jgi:hypothetical protein
MRGLSVTAFFFLPIGLLPFVASSSFFSIASAEFLHMQKLYETFLMSLLFVLTQSRLIVECSCCR